MEIVQVQVQVHFQNHLEFVTKSASNGGHRTSTKVCNSAASTKMLLLTTLALLMLDRTSAQNISLNLTRFDPPEQLDVGVSRHVKNVIPPF